MKKIMLFTALMLMGIFAQAQIIITNTSACPFAMTALYPGGSGVSFSIAPPGVTTLPGTFVGVACSTNPNTVGQNDGGMFIAPIYASGSYAGFPSSGSFLVVGCGMVNVNVMTGSFGSVNVNIN